MTYTLHFVEAGTARPGLTFTEALSIGRAYGTKHLITNAQNQIAYDSECRTCQEDGPHLHLVKSFTDTDIDEESRQMGMSRIERILDDEMDLN